MCKPSVAARLSRLRPFSTMQMKLAGCWFLGKHKSGTFQWQHAASAIQSCSSLVQCLHEPKLSLPSSCLDRGSSTI